MTRRQIFLKLIYPLVMLRAKLFPHKKEIQVNVKKVKPGISFYELKAFANNGSSFSFDQLAGKKVLIVNTASDCGYTAQYTQLEKLSNRYKDKLVVLGFPANDFKEQEKESDHAIAEFCKINFGVSFPLMRKSSVIKGPEQNPVFAWLSQKEQNGWCDQQPVWNFSKYLVNEEGILTHFFAQTVSPMSSVVKRAVRSAK